jgi:hypothetical protein
MSPKISTSKNGRRWLTLCTFSKNLHEATLMMKGERQLKTQQAQCQRRSQIEGRKEELDEADQKVVTVTRGQPRCKC